MATAVISDKYQVVIPKQVREPLGLKIGQEIIMHPLVAEGGILLMPKKRSKKPWYEQLRGLGKDVWAGIDPVAYVRSLRDEWN